MNAQKRNRLIAATTVTVVLLLVVLVAVMIYQIVEICVLDKRKKELQEEIAYYEEQIAEKEDEMADINSSGDSYYKWLAEYYEKILEYENLYGSSGK